MVSLVRWAEDGGFLNRRSWVQIPPGSLPGSWGSDAGALNDSRNARRASIRGSSRVRQPTGVHPIVSRGLPRWVVGLVAATYIVGFGALGSCDRDQRSKRGQSEGDTSRSNHAVLAWADIVQREPSADCDAQRNQFAFGRGEEERLTPWVLDRFLSTAVQETCEDRDSEREGEGHIRWEASA